MENDKKEEQVATIEVKNANVVVPSVVSPAENVLNTNKVTEGGTDVEIKGKLPAEVQIAISDAIVKVKDSLTANFVTILGIFASFITFLGIEIQILKNICDYWRIIGFSFFILTAVLIFVFSIYIFVDHVNSKGWSKIFGMFLTVTILLSSAFFMLSKSGDEYVCKLTQLNDKFQELDAKYSKRNNERLTNVETRLQDLENK